MVKNKDYDIVWIDKGHTILPSTLKYIKKISPNTIIVSYSPDNMALRHNQTQQYLETIPLYDYFFTNKSYILDNMRKLGAKNIFFVNNSYEETFHHPYNLTEQERIELGGDVGPNLKIEDHGLKGIDYSKSLQAFKISLCFLRKINYDLQTSRSVEIPACSGFMMAERTDEHLSMFEENKEAVYFSSKEELLEKCKYYLVHDSERKSIALAGRKRCITSGYSNEGMIRSAFKLIYNKKG